MVQTPASARRDLDALAGLVEREAELEALSAVVAAGREGNGGFALIDAAAGLGKSRLCAVARAWGEAGEMDVLSATAGPLDREFPFGVARKLFDRRLARAGTSERAALLAGAAEVAAPLFVGADRLACEQEEPALLYGLYWLAVGCSERRPLLLLVDDAQWADRSSLRFLLYLAQRLEDLPIAMVVAARSREPGADTQLLRALAGSERVLSPRPLSEHGVARMVRERGLTRADDAFCTACANATRGNPFVLVELLRKLNDEGVAATWAAAERVASLTPEVVLRALLDRLAMLPQAAVALTRAVAVLGDDADLRRAALLAELDLDEAADAADALAAAEIMAAGHPIRFEHPLVRATIYDDLPAARRGRMHARAARILDADGESVEMVAAQLLASNCSGDEWVVERLAHGARLASSRGAHAVAAHLLRRALAEPPDTALRGRLLHELGRAQAADRDPQALTTLSGAVEQLAEPSERARALGDVGRTLFAAGRLADAAKAFERGLHELGEPEGPLARELEAGYVAAATGTSSVSIEDRARLDRLLAEHPGVEPPAERALLAAVALRGALTGEPAERVRGLALRALSGDGVETAIVRDGMEPVADDIGPMADDMDLVAASIALIYVDELDGCLRALNRAIDHARRVGSGGAFTTANHLRAWPLYLTGALHEAIADAEQALDAMCDGSYRPLGATYTILIHAHLDTGDVDAARRVLTAAERQAEAESAVEYVVPHGARGRLKLVQGDPSGALEDLRTQGRLLAEMGCSNYPIPWRPAAALAALALGDRAQARRLATEELELAEHVDAARGIGVALRAAGLVAGGKRGIELLKRSVAALESSPALLEYARALVDLGALLRRTGERAGAREPLRRGREIAHRLGAIPLVEQATQELQATGARPRRIQLSGVDSLTASERRIATMAATGMTNPQIAQALFVTRKTVEFHLGNAYGKLGISSRADLSGALEPAG